MKQNRVQGDSCIYHLVEGEPIFSPEEKPYLSTNKGPLFVCSFVYSLKQLELSPHGLPAQCYILKKIKRAKRMNLPPRMSTFIEEYAL